MVCILTVEVGNASLELLIQIVRCDKVMQFWVTATQSIMGSEKSAQGSKHVVGGCETRYSRDWHGAEEWQRGYKCVHCLARTEHDL